MGCGTAGQPGRGADLDPVQLLGGSASRARRTSWVRMVMRGVRCCSMLVVYLEARLITSYSSGATATGITARPAPMTTA